MRDTSAVRRSALLALVALGVLGGCHGGLAPFPGGGGTPTPFPTNCTTAAPNTTVFVAMAAAVTPTSVPTFGTINGYGPSDVIGDFSNVAATVTATSSDIVQFINVESSGPQPIFHSAVGLGKVTAFPSPTVSFSPQAAQPEGSSITTGTWSTGRVPPPSALTGFCFSQPFTLSPGTYFFGDLDYYNTANMRDVIIVSP